jgi:hypothetical protein
MPESACTPSSLSTLARSSVIDSSVRAAVTRPIAAITSPGRTRSENRSGRSNDQNLWMSSAG